MKKLKQSISFQKNHDIFSLIINRYVKRVNIKKEKQLLIKITCNKNLGNSLINSSLVVKKEKKRGAGCQTILEMTMKEKMR